MKKEPGVMKNKKYIIVSVCGMETVTRTVTPSNYPFGYMLHARKKKKESAFNCPT